MIIYATPDRIAPLFGAAVMLSMLATTGSSACIDDGISAFADSPRTVSLCLKDRCETAVLFRVCGNIHYSSHEYETDSERWLFRVRFHQDRNEGDEHSVTLNGTAIPHSLAQQVICISQHDESGCEFIDEVLGNVLAE